MTRRILAAGHDIGLHFDAGAYSTKSWTTKSLEPAVARERSLLEAILGREIRCLSWHNPDLSNLLEFTGETIGGLISAYSARMRRDYVYGSDSNGYWRFTPIPDVIAEGNPRLHLLTHPEWWTAESMSPSARIDRAILGRARKTRADYDSLLGLGGRKNLTN